MSSREQRDYYAQRAEQVRAILRTASDGGIKDTLATMAAAYDRLVEEHDRLEPMRRSPANSERG